MAEFSPVLPVRDGGGRFGQPIFPRSRSGSESESELSQSLARTKIRSYGSTASVTASLGEKYIEHRVTDSDTLQGIALKYGVTVRFPHSRCSVSVSSDLMGHEAGFHSFHQSSVRLRGASITPRVSSGGRSAEIFHESFWTCGVDAARAL